MDAISFPGLLSEEESSRPPTSSSAGQGNPDFEISIDVLPNYDDCAPEPPARTVTPSQGSNKETLQMSANPLDHFALSNDSDRENLNYSKYGYGPGSPGFLPSVKNKVKPNPSPRRTNPSLGTDGKPLERRSSLKGSRPTAITRTPGVNRRASMGSTTLLEVRVRGQRFPVQKRRSIDFAKTVEVKEVEPISSLVDSMSELWLQPHDFVNMKNERRSVVIKHKKGHADPVERPDETLRGLEKYVDKTIRAQKNMACRDQYQSRKARVPLHAAPA